MSRRIVSRRHRSDRAAFRADDRYERDPVLIAMSPLAFTLSGLERVGDQDYAQSWLVKLAQ